MSSDQEIQRIQQIQHQIIQDFQLFPDWMERYAYLVDLGKSLIQNNEKVKSEENRLAGCQSNVWLKTVFSDNKLYFSGTSDSTIVAGLMALLFRIYSGYSAEAIHHTTPFFITETELISHLSSQRSTGLMSMIQRIQDVAEKHCHSPFP